MQFALGLLDSAMGAHLLVKDPNPIASPSILTGFGDVPTAAQPVPMCTCAVLEK